MTVSQADKAKKFRALHEAPGSFVIPNPWDGGSARVLAGLGFEARATSRGAKGGGLASGGARQERGKGERRGSAGPRQADLRGLRPAGLGRSREGLRRCARC